MPAQPTCEAVNETNDLAVVSGSVFEPALIRDHPRQVFNTCKRLQLRLRDVFSKVGWKLARDIRFAPFQHRSAVECVLNDYRFDGFQK